MTDGGKTDVKAVVSKSTMMSAMRNTMVVHFERVGLRTSCKFIHSQIPEYQTVVTTFDEELFRHVVVQ